MINKKATRVLDQAIANPLVFDDVYIRKARIALEDDHTIGGDVARLVQSSGSRPVGMVLVSEYEVVDADHHPHLAKFRGWVAQTPVPKESSDTKKTTAKLFEMKALDPEKHASLTFDDVQERVEKDGGFVNKTRYFPPLFQSAEEFVSSYKRLRRRIYNEYPWTHTMNKNNVEDRIRMGAFFGLRSNKSIAAVQWRNGGGVPVTNRILRKMFPRMTHLVWGSDHVYLHWVKTVLGHDNSNTSRNYINVIVKTVVELPDPSMVSKLADMTARIEVLEAQTTKRVVAVVDNDGYGDDMIYADFNARVRHRRKNGRTFIYKDYPTNTKRIDFWANRRRTGDEFVADVGALTTQMRAAGISTIQVEFKKLGMGHKSAKRAAALALSSA
jgi:hypothetical protein